MFCSLNPSRKRDEEDYSEAEDPDYWKPVRFPAEPTVPVGRCPPSWEWSRLKQSAQIAYHY